MTNSDSDKGTKKANSGTRKAAIALEYDGDNTPTVAASGLDEIAEQIIAMAMEHDVPLYENAELARQLADIDLGAEIPEKLFLAIAHIIAFAYHLQGKTPKNWASSFSEKTELTTTPGRLFDQ